MDVVNTFLKDFSKVSLESCSEAVGCSEVEGVEVAEEERVVELVLL